MSEEKNVCEFEACIEAKHLPDFKIYHNYHSVSGIATLLFGVIMLVVFVISIGQVNVTYSLMTGFFGLFFTVYTPIGMILKTKKQIKKNPAFGEPIKYTVSEQKIIVSQADIQEELKWDDIYKIKSTGKCFVIYVTSIRANIIPFECVGTQAEHFLAIARKKLAPFQIKVNDSKVIAKCNDIKL